MKRIVSAVPRADPRAGFTLIEALAALAIAAAIMALLAELAGQALRNWNRSTASMANMEMLTTGLARLSIDIARALPIPDTARPPSVRFRGGARSLVFAAVTGLGAGDHGIELIAMTAVTDSRGTALVRQRAPLAEATPTFGDDVILLHGPFDIRFTYRDHDGRRLAEWSGRSTLPRSVEVEFLDERAAGVLSPPVVLPVETNLPADCVAAYDNQSGDGRCSLRSTARAISGQ